VPGIDVVDLTRHHGFRPVPKDIYLHIDAGKPVVIDGLNGMDK
jgi:hypothetical protein